MQVRTTSVRASVGTAQRERQHMIEAGARPVGVRQSGIDWLLANTADPSVALEHLAMCEPLGIDAVHRGAPVMLEFLAALALINR